MKKDRIQKAQSISKKILSEFIVFELQDLSIEHGLITITDVVISPDLSYLDAYVSGLKNEETLCKNLAEHAHILQRKLWKDIDFIKVPKIRFRYDSSWKTSSEIHQTLKQLDEK